MHALVWIGPVVAVLGFAGWIFRVSDPVAKAMRRVPRGDAGALVAGRRVRLVGIACSIGEHVVTPNVEQRCLAFVVTAYEKSSTAQVARSAAFELELVDTGRRVAIAPAGKDAVRVSGDRLATPLGGATGYGASLVNRQLINKGGMIGHVYENVIEDGVTIAVVGTVEVDANGAPRLAGTAAEPLMISSLPAAAR